MFSKFTFLFLILISNFSCRSESGSDNNSGIFEGQQSASTLTAVLSQIGVTGPSEIAKLCEEHSDAIQQLTRNMSFRARSGCRFGEAGNGPPEAGVLQAQATSQSRLKLPANALLCELKVESRENRPVIFADDLYFTLNRMVIFGSNTSIISGLRREGERMIRFSFPEIRGQPVNNNDVIPYCHRESFFCLFNRASENSFVRVTLEPAILSDIAYQLLGTEDVNARVTVTGDNGENDCSHSDLTFQLNLKYLTLGPNGVI